MEIIVLSKKNPFANSSASSNRLIGLLKGLKQEGANIKILILGGFFCKDEFSSFGLNGTFEGVDYFYIGQMKNFGIWQKRVNEYILKKINLNLSKIKTHKFISNLSGRTIFWIENEYSSMKLVDTLSSFKNSKLFMEINEFPDVHLYNKSNKYLLQTYFSNKSLYFFYNRTLNKLDGLALMTNTLIEFYKSKINSKTKLLHLPMTVDLERFDLSKSYETIECVKSPYIAFVGSMNDAKDGVNILIEAFGKVANKFPDINLALFGFWAYDSQDHQNRIRELGIEQRVVYARPIDSEKVVNLIMNSEILVLPRPDSYQAKGGFPTKLGEYLAAAKPVIVTRVGEIPNYLEDNKSAFFVEPGSIDSLEKKFEEVLSNLHYAKMVGINGRLVAEMNFNSDLQAKKLSTFLNSL